MEESLVNDELDIDSEIKLKNKRKEIEQIIDESIEDKEESDRDVIQSDENNNEEEDTSNEISESKKLKTSHKRSISAPEVSQVSKETISTISAPSDSIFENPNKKEVEEDNDELERSEYLQNSPVQRQTNASDHEPVEVEDNNEEGDSSSEDETIELPIHVQQTEDINQPIMNPEAFKQQQRVFFQTNYSNLIGMLETFDDKDVHPQWTEDTLVKWLKAFELFWTPKNEEGVESYEPNDLFEMIKRNLNITTFESIDPNYVQELADKKAFYPLINLQMRFTAMGYLMNDVFEKSEEYTNRFYKLMHDIFEVCEMMFHYVNYIWMKKHNYTGPVEAKIGMFQWDPKFDPNTLNTYQKSLIFCLFQLKKKNYRRYGEDIYAPIYNRKNQFTFSWKKVKSIDEFVVNSADLLSQKNSFLNLTDARGANPSAAANFLKKYQCAFFPELKPSQYLTSWENGVYNTLNSTFHTYEEIEKKHTEFQKDLTKIIDFENAGYFGRQQILKEMLDKKGDKQNEITVNQVNIDIPESELTDEQRVDLEIKKWSENQKTPFSNPYVSACSLSFIPQKFIDYTHVKDWREIPTPYFDGIINYQPWQNDTKEFFHAFYGRNFFGLGDYKGERWQAAPFLLGVSDSAKSTLLGPIQSIIPKEVLGILNSRVEKQFGLQNLLNYGKNIAIIGFEVGADCTLCVEDLKSIITGEIVKISIKNLQSIDVVVKCPLICAMNAFPKMWRNDGFSLEKRALIFYFSKKIDQHTMKTDYSKYLELELSKVLQKTTRAYKELVDKIGKNNIWLHAPEEIKNNVKNFLSDNDPLKAYLKDATYCELDKDSYVSEQKFQEQFSLYCTSRNIKMPAWKKSYYDTIFEANGIEIKAASKQQANGTFQYQNYVFGVKLIEHSKPNNQQNNQPNNQSNNQQKTSEQNKTQNNFIEPITEETTKDSYTFFSD